MWCECMCGAVCVSELFMRRSFLMVRSLDFGTAYVYVSVVQAD